MSTGMNGPRENSGSPATSGTTGKNAMTMVQCQESVITRGFGRNAPKSISDTPATTSGGAMMPAAGSTMTTIMTKNTGSLVTSTMTGGGATVTTSSATTSGATMSASVGGERHAIGKTGVQETAAATYI